ncbi:GNAT family N-acetyltransferase [Brevundimonas diminuta]|uniref:GNAT family N-acetyltransferase n=1 Tax=Brevundimonas diminuta TaxID=293 RepID=UPI0020979A50|nr:GNAT family N-acetyltransferase [Brevundimonas diminuta]MCO8029461.1 GNAT family N-acetyltransferase [Brevundimonas diminuta]
MSLRPFNESDLEAVNRLHSSVWWPERSAAGWRWLMANPASAEIDAPHGWVIDHGAGPRAFVGNFIQRFWRNDQRLHAATGYSIVVPPAQRGRSRALINAFIDQPACFARYTLNANARSSPLYQRHGMVPWPPETHTLKLSWLIDPAACLYGRGLREIVDRAPTLARLLGEQLSPLPRLNGERRLRQAESRLPDGVSLSPDLSQRSDYAGSARRGAADGGPQPGHHALASVGPRSDGAAAEPGLSRRRAPDGFRRGHAEQADAAGTADPGDHRPGRAGQ